MATWAARSSKTPTPPAPQTSRTLRDAGLSDTQIFAITAFVALRMAFGVTPDAQLVAALPPAVAAAVTYGRPPDAPSP